jgi:hypothetical protein
MKYIISFFITFNAYAFPLRIFHENGSERAEIVRNILIKGYGVPGDLIVTKNIQSCDEIAKKGKFDLCLKNNGDLLVVSVDRGFVNDSLKIFQAP